MASIPVFKRQRSEEFLDSIKSLRVCSKIEDAGEGLKIGTHDGKLDLHATQWNYLFS